MSKKPKPKMEVKPHSFTRKLLSWWYCAHCGLMALNNETSRKAAREPCDRD